MGVRRDDRTIGCAPDPITLCVPLDIMTWCLAVGQACRHATGPQRVDSGVRARVQPMGALGMCWVLVASCRVRVSISASKTTDDPETRREHPRTAPPTPGDCILASHSANLCVLCRLCALRDLRCSRKQMFGLRTQDSECRNETQTLFSSLDIAWICVACVPACLRTQRSSGARPTASRQSALTSDACAHTRLRAHSAERRASATAPMRRQLGL